ncbi:MAG: S8 family serine peptidase, partial [Flavobacteriia bacterium]|nr:S8 family serine peptidase [Flavobacteriia bacterium]
MRNYLHYLLILLFGVTQWGMAQTPQQAAKIVATYDQNELNKLKNEADLKYQYERNRVLDLAPKMGLPLIIDDGVTRSELQRILPDGTPIYYTTQNKDASHSTRTDHLNSGGSLGLNLMGQNMTAYVWDGGIARATHQEYSGRYTVGDGSSALSDHGAHVTGTIIASGVVAQAKGMAPQGKVRGYDWNNDITEATIAAANGMLVSNHSYGWVSNNLPAWYFGNYHSESASWDNIMFNAPYYLMVKSAGNDGAVNYNSSPLGGIVGYDKLTGAGTSKNSLVIANAQDANVNSNGDLISVSINSGSSQGPTDDYRIKPDITGNGTGLYSPISTNNSAYATYTGTSMSSPNVTGTLLLLQQHYNNINSEFMRAATLKGLVLHTADDAGPVGPDVVWGWGLLNAKRAAQVISNNGNGTLIQELTLNNGETYEFDVYSDEVSNLMASISWTDRPGANREGELNNTTPVLVNDLDLRIIKGGTSYEPWKLTGVTTNAKGDNFRDPFERVEVSNPTGQYKIRITHKGSLTGGSQKYSLIITGISDQPIECNPVVPAGLTATSVGTTTADLIWNMVPAAEYDFRYRATGSGSWITSSTATNTISLTGLTQDTEYEAQVRSKCSGGSNSAWSSSYIFTTLLPSTECGIDYAVNLGGTALGDTSAGIILTSDFPVGADVNLSVETVKFPMSNQVSTVKVSFYKDASGTPGDEVLSPTSVVPVSQTVISGEVYEITLDLSSLNLELEGGSTGTNYWMAITTTGTNANYWRSTDQIYNGTNGYGSLDNYASFEDLTNYGYVLDFAFTIEGDCGGNEQYTVVTSANPTAGGTTTGDGTYDGGDSVTVSATENTGYEFQNWTEGGTVVSTDSDYNFTIQSDRNLVANFSQTEYVITTNSNPITGGNTVGGGTYHYGDTATVTATATIGYTFVSWTEGGTVVSTNNTYSFTVDSSRTLTANFEMMDFMIITSSNPFAGGVTTGGGAYNYGDTATVSAFANTGYSFTSWTEGGIVVSTDPNYSFTVTSSRTLVANFDQLGYLITTMSSPAAGGTTSGGGSYNYGDTATVSATANAGYTFVNWTEGGTVVSND